MDMFAQYIFLQRLNANETTSVRRFNPQNKLFTKLSWDTDINGIPYTVEAYKIRNSKHYYANVIYDGQSIQKINPKTSLYASAAEVLYKTAMDVLHAQSQMAKKR